MIVLFGSVAELEYAEKILRNYDSISTSQSSVSEMDGQLVTKRIYIEYGNGPEIAGMLQRSFPLRQFIWDGELRILTERPGKRMGTDSNYSGGQRSSCFYCEGYCSGYK